MNLLALKGEVSRHKQKMLTQKIPRLRRANVVLNSLASCITNTSEEFSWTPEVSFSEPLSQPRVLSHQSKRAISLEQLQCSAHTHCWGQLDEQMHMINSDMQFIDSAFVSFSSFLDKSFTIDFHEFKFKWVPSILGFPHEVESILPEGMAKTCKIHFLSPAQQKARELTLSNFLVFIEGNVSPHETKVFPELNYLGDGDSSLCLKAEVSSPCM